MSLENYVSKLSTLLSILLFVVVVDVAVSFADHLSYMRIGTIFFFEQYRCRRMFELL